MKNFTFSGYRGLAAYCLAVMAIAVGWTLSVGLICLSILMIAGTLEIFKP